MKLSFLGFLLIFQLTVGPTQAASEKVVEAAGPLGPLKGIHTTPDRASAPVILIIPGSGPTDRDGNNPQGVSASTYKYLAKELAELQVQSVRIDKRGMFSSHAAIKDANQVTLEDYADDVHSWIRTIHSETNVACVWLLGHSEGGLVALVSAQRKEFICGIILTAAPGRKFGDILRQQLKDNPANEPILKDALQAVRDLEAGNFVDVSGFHPALQQLFFPSVQNYLINIMSYSPSELISSLSLPILILQGDRDLQIGKMDAKALSEANSNAVLRILSNVNHVLKRVNTNNRAENFATYSNPALPLAEGVTATIVEFVKSN